MSCSAKQLAANRRNAKKSTGPRTPAGKAVSSRNATRHGLYAKATLIDAPNLKEDKREYQKLVHGLIDELHPDGDDQLRFVLKIARCLWLRQRATEAEIRFVSSLPNPTTPDDCAMLTFTASRFNRDLSRYEWALDNTLANSLDSLHDLQSRQMASNCRSEHKIAYIKPISNTANRDGCQSAEDSRFPGQLNRAGVLSPGPRIAPG